MAARLGKIRGCISWLSLGGGQRWQVAYIGSDHHVHELYAYVGGPWGHADLTQLTGAPAPDGLNLTGYGCPPVAQSKLFSHMSIRHGGSSPS